MLKRWIGLLLFVVAIALVVLGSSGWQAQLAEKQANSQPVRDLASRNFVGSIEPPTIDPQRLLADVEALSFQRYTESDRSRARDYIQQSLEQAGWTIEKQAFGEATAAGINLYAERSGSDPEAGKILLAAHYDTVELSPGADDNATSVATVLEAARLLAQTSTPRTLEIALFDLEEAGLLGSVAFAEQLASAQDLQGAIIMDMIGYACYESGCQSYPDLLPIEPPTDRGDFLAVIGDQGHPDLIKSFTQANPPDLPQVLTLAIPTFGRLTPDLVRSDHVPFWRRGIGAVLVTDTANFRNPNYHQATDTPETLDQDFFVGATQRVVNATTALLMQDNNG